MTAATGAGSARQRGGYGLGLVGDGGPGGRGLLDRITHQLGGRAVDGTGRGEGVVGGADSDTERLGEGELIACGVLNHLRDIPFRARGRQLPLIVADTRDHIGQSAVGGGEDIAPDGAHPGTALYRVGRTGTVALSNVAARLLGRN